MNAILLSKEFKSLFNSPVGVIFLTVFLVATGMLLWLIPGAYHIPDAGYASLDGFFSLVPVLLIVLIPGLSGRAFSEEKNRKTLDLLLTRPVKVWRLVFAKCVSVFSVVCIALLLTSVYVLSIYWFALPVGNIDWGAIVGSYVGMLFLSASLVAISVFASSLTSNQVFAFILALAACVWFYYGFELLAGLFLSGKMQLFIRYFGLYAHVESIQRGVIDSRDLLVFLSVGAVFFMLTLAVISVYTNYKKILWGIVCLLLINVLGSYVHSRWDLTAEKRYSIAPQTKHILQSLKTPLEVELYLSGDLNAGFTRLKQATLDMLSEFQPLAPGMISVRITDPYRSDDPKTIEKLNEKGILGIAVNERNKKGKMTQKIVFPWVMLKNQSASLPVSLLVHLKERSGEENLNASVEDMEYQLIKGIYALNQPGQRKIAFIEGHGELPEEMLGDISDALSAFYQVDRGNIPPDVSLLNDYEVLIIAGSQLPFSESDKYVLDQYLMRGGKVLFLINGVRMQLNQLAETGETVVIANETQLDDVLFTYGVRINPVVMEDARCLTIPVHTTPEGAEGTVKTLPWYFAPILTPYPDHPITKDVMFLKSEFVSSLSLVGNNPDIRKTPLLLTSGYARSLQVPEMLSLRSAGEIRDAAYFNEKDVLVGVLLEGIFPSVFYRRPVPGGVISDHTITQSKPTRMIVIGSEEIIRNEVVDGQSVPLGYDRLSGIQFGNKDFLVNAVNYLADDSGLMNVRNKHLKIRLLDQQKMEKSATFLIGINLLLPVFLAWFLFFILILFRKKKYFL